MTSRVGGYQDVRGSLPYRQHASTILSLQNQIKLK